MRAGAGVRAVVYPGLLHFYVHIMEMSPYPERALPAAYQLETLLPDAGHLVHMPTHIYAQVGMWDKSVYQNALAVRAGSGAGPRHPRGSGGAADYCS